MERIENWFGRISIDHPFLCILLCLLIVGGASYGARDISFDADPSIYFSDDHEHYRFFKNLERDYGRSDSIIMALKIKEGSIYTPTNLINHSIAV